MVRRASLSILPGEVMSTVTPDNDEAEKEKDEEEDCKIRNERISREGKRKDLADLERMRARQKWAKELQDETNQQEEEDEKLREQSAKFERKRLRSGMDTGNTLDQNL